MKKWELKIARGYDPRSQSKVGLFAAQLDDQLARLKKGIKGLTVRQLEWQPHPGMNTIGMLLAHIALAEAWWIRVAPAEIEWEPRGKNIVRKICGFDDDGIPLPSKGKHPVNLKGLSADDYLKILAKVRRAGHTEMKKWKDKDLDKYYRLEGASATRVVTLYHVLEHFCSHFGQILMLKHLMCDKGVLKKQDKKRK